MEVPALRVQAGRKSVRRYCAEHEAFLEAALKEGVPPQHVLEVHEKRLRWLQHERLMHLLATAMVEVFFIFSACLAVFVGGAMAYVLTAVLLCLLAAYICHYRFLENTVQAWYSICDSLDKDRQRASRG